MSCHRAAVAAMVALWLGATAVHGATYTCTGSDGRKTFSDRPCPGSAVSRSPSAAAAAPAVAHGLTYGLVSNPGAGDNAVASCHASPAPADRPRGGANCDPYRGDTACTRRLPLLCWQPGAAAAGAPRGVREPTRIDAATGRVTPPATVGGSIGRGPVIEGLALRSEAAASLACEQALGPGWRVARFHDEPLGWQLIAKGHDSLRNHGAERYWVAIGDQPGNCWDDISRQRAVPPPETATVPRQSTAEDRQMIDAWQQMRRSGIVERMSPLCRRLFEQVERHMKPYAGTVGDGAFEPMLDWLGSCAAEVERLGATMPAPR